LASFGKKLFDCYSLSFLGTISKLRKATISFVLLVCRMKQLGSHCTDFNEIWYLIIFEKIEKIQVSLKLDKNNRYIAEDR